MVAQHVVSFTAVFQLCIMHHQVRANISCCCALWWEGTNKTSCLLLQMPVLVLKITDSMACRLWCGVVWCACCVVVRAFPVALMATQHCTMMAATCMLCWEDQVLQLCDGGCLGIGRLWVLVNSISHTFVVCACQILHALGIRRICAVVCRAHQLLEMQHLVLGADDVFCQM
jgi:hypothetical protein